MDTRGGVQASVHRPQASKQAQLSTGLWQNESLGSMKANSHYLHGHDASLLLLIWQVLGHECADLMQAARASDIGDAMLKAATDLADPNQGPPDPLDPWDNARGSALQVCLGVRGAIPEQQHV